jgi:gliding motility-associated protein GldC
MSEDEVKKTSSNKVDVGTNENAVPVRMKWTAEDGNIDNRETTAMFLSMWDPKEKNTMKMDLWTKDMSVEEMKQFFHQTLVTMADTFERATGENLISEDLRDYCYHFAQKMEIMPED